MKYIGTIRRMPIWSKVVALLIVPAGIATAMAGSGIVGDNPVLVNNPLTVVSGAVGTNEAVIFNDDQDFTVSAQAYPGDSYEIELVLQNLSTVNRSERLNIEAPDGFKFTAVEADQGPNVSVNQESSRTFVYTVDSDDDDTTTGGTSADTAEFSTSNNTLTIDVKVLPQTAPGFYTIEMVTNPLASS